MRRNLWYVVAVSTFVSTSASCSFPARHCKSTSMSRTHCRIHAILIPKIFPLQRLSGFILSDLTVASTALESVYTGVGPVWVKVGGGGHSDGTGWADLEFPVR